jgi:formylglycine-generating enzyme required for sulfatase activity
MREEHPATRQGFVSLEFSEDGFGVPAQRKPRCAASHDNLGCLGTDSMDEFESNGYEFHTVSGNVWEWTHSSFHLRNAAETKAANLSTRKVRV